MDFLLTISHPVEHLGLGHVQYSGVSFLFPAELAFHFERIAAE
jgi:hypothetical protein